MTLKRKLGVNPSKANESSRNFRRRVEMKATVKRGFFRSMFLSGVASAMSGGVLIYMNYSFSADVLGFILILLGAFVVLLSLEL